jgi:Ni,Fe-hydrogenase maturation factor
MKILVYGFGNPGRQDDGLGIFFVNEFEKWVLKKKKKRYIF